MGKFLLFLLSCFITMTLQAEPLPAAEAFQLHVEKVDPNTFTLNWHIKPGYFLYSDRIKLNTPPNSNIHLGPLRLPSPQIKVDKQKHSYTIYKDELSIPVNLLANDPGEALLLLSYQGCSDQGFCYPPEKKQIHLKINDQLAISEATLENSSTQRTMTKTASHDKIAQIFTTHHWFVTLAIFFGFGLLLSFTPCILPMIPVLSGIIIGHDKEVNTKKAFFLSLSYVLSMSVTYAIVGALVALIGANLQISMQSPWAISLFSAIFILLALSMFGFYEFKLPEAWQSKMAGPNYAERGGHYLGAAIMGCLSTLILSPCVTAPLIGTLSYIAQTGNILLGSLTLFILSLGMGTPLLLIGTSAGKWLPQAGSWMNAVKAFFGILLLAVAIYLMARIIPEGLTMLFWASLLIFSGIYAGALTQAVTSQEKFCQGVGILLLGYGLLILIGASMGTNNPLQPLANLTMVTKASSAAIPASQSNQNLDEIKKTITAVKGKPVLLDFYADWCLSCKVMEATVFKDPSVEQLLTQFKVIKIDITANNEQNKELMKYFKVVAPPTYLFFNAEGEELNELKIIGEASPNQFLDILKSASYKDL